MFVDREEAAGNPNLTLLTALRMRESNPEPSGNKFTKSQHHQPKHEGNTFTGFIDWEEWAEYEKDNNLTKALQQPENISQAGNRHRTKWATERDQHVSLHHGSRRERFPSLSPPSTSQIRCMRFCCLLKGSPALARPRRALMGHRGSRTEMKPRTSAN